MSDVRNISLRSKGGLQKVSPIGEKLCYTKAYFNRNKPQ
jgi:hypothetical protein